MQCPICSNYFLVNDYSLKVYHRTVYFCSEVCYNKAEKILRHNCSASQYYLRTKLEEEINKSQPKSKPITKIKKGEAKQDTKPKRKFKSFGVRLFFERVCAGLSEKELAEAVGVESETIELLEEGIVTPTNFIITKIAEVLGISKGKLMPKKK